jgi:hypothetical protein
LSRRPDPRYKRRSYQRGLRWRSLS